MALETVNSIADLVITNPTSGDPVSQGDNHIQNIKKALKTDLPNITGPVTATQTQLDYCAVTTLGTAQASKALTADSGGLSKSVLLDDGTCYFANATTPTKQLGVDVSGATSSTTMTLSSSQTASRTLTLPDATDTLVCKDTTDVLTNKTIDTASNTLTVNVSDISDLGQAVQADVEAETNQDTYIPPDLLHHHPGIAKAWVKFTDTGSDGAQTIDASYPSGASVNRTSAGNYTVTWNRTFSSNAYCIVASAQKATGTPLDTTIRGQATINCGIVITDDAGAATSPDSVHIMAFGDI